MECIKCDQPAMSESDYCAACEKKELSKIGGWLWFPLTALILNGCIYTASFVNNVNILVLNYKNISNTLKLLLIYETAMMLALVTASIYLGSIFFRKKRTLPLYYIILLITAIAVDLSDLWLADHLLQIEVSAADIERIVQKVIHAAIWIPYFLISVRVKRTFIH
ncbi:DUF2569 family protein [Erwinia aphidicola]|uniref:DUF2569 family protein n=1 Tax=Erwinia aphidicola TaxID=68334 RepID=UPI0016547D08